MNNNQNTNPEIEMLRKKQDVEFADGKDIGKQRRNRFEEAFKMSDPHFIHTKSKDGKLLVRTRRTGKAKVDELAKKVDECEVAEYEMRKANELKKAKEKFFKEFGRKSGNSK